jgi:formylglycine-generating enzyme required for sulfatase activity
LTGFRLDAFDVTVGRYRQFVAASVAGWVPATGSGKHAYLNGGLGLPNSGTGGGHETGWQATWTANLPTTASDWTSQLQCSAADETWTSTAGANEARPINCETWFEAYAFCIWDGGFLPSEAELNYAFMGGSDERVYPWSNPSSSTTIDCTYANYFGASGGTAYCVSPPTGATNNVGSESPKGDGRWGQSDLAGNVYQWVLDLDDIYTTPCSDCANTTDTGSSVRVIRGGSYSLGASLLVASSRNDSTPFANDDIIGVRCGRSP